jgi:hypothetical protein
MEGWKRFIACEGCSCCVKEGWRSSTGAEEVKKKAPHYVRGFLVKLAVAIS